MTRTATKWTRKGYEVDEEVRSRHVVVRAFRKLVQVTHETVSTWTELAHRYFISLILRSFGTLFKSVPYARNAKKGELVDGRSGLASTINVSCTECGESNMFQTSKRSQRGMFEINERFVYALQTCGKGLQAGRVMCAVLNMPPPNVNGKSLSCQTRRYCAAPPPLAPTSGTAVVAGSGAPGLFVAGCGERA